MREILFRAKGQTSGKWYVGLLTRLDQDVCHIKDKRHNEWICDSQTVCQYTGLTDKNGISIFENDIVRLPKCDNDMAVFSKKGCNYFLKGKHSDYVLGSYESECYEVIGNIYENADLLKE